MSRPTLLRARLAALALACCALTFPTGAGAATVINGGFETGNLDGWTIFSNTGKGNWFAYTGTEGPISLRPLYAPPQGNWAAGADENNIDTVILYQDVALEPFSTHRLAATLYYTSGAPIAVPSPNTLLVPGVAPDNQQFRFDVIRPTAALTSLDPADILATPFATAVGHPTGLAPTPLTTDLSPFAGQTVRLRIATVAGDNYLVGGADAISITSTSPAPPVPAPPSNEFSRGKVQLTPGTGGGFLAINVPGPGVIKTVDARTKIATATARTSLKAVHTRIRRSIKSPKAAGQVLVPLHPNNYGFKQLEEKGRLKVRVRVTYTPTGGVANTKSFNVTLKLAPSGGGPSR
ncbi:MAG TPA: hypothetical protein VHR18_10615 [Solirubrobacterales bacterium]|jgi:hypothetical protein|nr:hypothetical protein [Solirubrobacterales bacterium]